MQGSSAPHNEGGRNRKGPATSGCARSGASWGPASSSRTRNAAVRRKDSLDSERHCAAAQTPLLECAKRIPLPTRCADACRYRSSTSPALHRLSLPLLLLLLRILAEARDVRVVVALDDAGAEQLSDTASATNKHSLRALWAADDFWDVQMQHDCVRASLRGGRCLFSSNLTDMERADAVLFSAQMFPAHGRFEEVLSQLSSKQSTILWNTEAVDTFRLGPQLPVLESKIDFVASYEMHADVPLLQGFPRWLQPDEFARPGNPVTPCHHCKSSIVWVASNCKTTTNDRMEFVRQFMRFMRVDSYGKCLTNMELPAGMEAQRGAGRKFWQDKVRLLGNYPMTLVLENSNVYDYVSEKVFQALLAGSIPVYLGTGNVEHFLPHSSAAIRVADFASPQLLAEHLQSVLQNMTALQLHHEWRRHPLPPAFLRLWDLSWDTAKCRICALVAAAENFQPAARMHRHASLVGVFGGERVLLERACRAEDALRLRLAARIYSTVLRLGAEGVGREVMDRARAGLRRLEGRRPIKVTVSKPSWNAEMTQHSLVVPLSAHQRMRGQAGVWGFVNTSGEQLVDTHTVMEAADEYCLSHGIPWGPACQDIYSAAGMKLESNGVRVPRAIPWQARRSQLSNETLCQTLQRLWPEADNVRGVK